MRIKLFYIHPDNYGNLMMCSSFIQHFRELWFEGSAMDIYESDNGSKSWVKEKTEVEEPEFYVDVLDERELQRVRQAVSKGTKVYREALYDKNQRGISGKLNKLFHLPKEISYCSKTYDICVVLGGDCISQYYSWQIFITDLIKFRWISSKIPVFMLGQTMGPFKGYAVWLMKACLKRCRIFVRDHDCFQYMNKTFSFKDIKESRDLAFLDIPRQNDVTETEWMKSITETGEYITVVPSGADRQYTLNTERYVEEYTAIIQYIIEHTKYFVLLLAHVIHVEDSNDKKIMDKIKNNLPEKYLQKIRIVDSLIQPYEARRLLGKGQFTITGRMHAAVSSINMGVIPICLSYSVKFKGVIGDDFGLNKLILQCRGDSEWMDNRVSEAVIQMLEFCLEHQEELVKSVKDHRAEVQKKAMDQITAVFCERNQIRKIH